MRTSRSRVLLGSVAGVALVASVASVPVAAGAAGGAGGAGSSTSSTGVVRQVTRQASTDHFPHSTTHSGGGAINLTENGKLQRFVNRSDSPRPATTRTSSGQIRLAAATTPPVPTVTPTPISGSQPGAVTGWQGLNEHDNQQYAGFSLEPPDQGLCAANGHVLEMINDVTRIYTSAGAPEATASLNDFFGEPGYQFTTDPSCLYDFGSGRFFATELTLDVNPKTGALTGTNWLDVAVSKTGDPTAGWNVYRIDVTDDGSNGTPSHKSCPCIGDFPHLGTDANGLFLTTNEYPFSGPGVYGNNFNGSQVYALSKAAVVSGSLRTNLVQFEHAKVSSERGHRQVGFTIWPAQAAGKNYARTRNGTMYFVSSLAAEEARPDDFSGYSNHIGLWWIANTASLNSASPSVSLQVKALSVPAYGIPPLASQKIGPTPLKDCLNVACRKGINDVYVPEDEGGLDSSDSRPLTAVYANGTVYSALDTAMVVAGNVQSGFEWFGLHADAGSSAVAHAGYVGVARNNVIYPTIATDSTGNGYLSVTLTGADYFPSQAYMRWSNGAGTRFNIAALGQAPEDGFCEYLYFNCAGTPTPQVRPRWGDYGYAAWDGSKFFMANEYIAKSCTFVQFNSDPTCGGTRTFFGNFSTHIQVLS